MKTFRSVIRTIYLVFFLAVFALIIGALSGITAYLIVNFMFSLF